MKFYKQWTPLSEVHDTPLWTMSAIGIANRKNEHVWIEENEYSGGWKVVDVFFSKEDSTMTYFQAFNQEQMMIPGAVFGVHWNDAPSSKRIPMRYGPKHSNLYIPIENKFHTPNTGGYSVQVLDADNPSELCHFGLSKYGDKHEALIIRFQLF